MKRSIFFIALVLGFICSANAQTWNKVAGRWQYQYLKADSVFTPPVDTLANVQIGSIAVKNDSIYLRSSTGWRNTGRIPVPNVSVPLPTLDFSETEPLRQPYEWSLITAEARYQWYDGVSTAHVNDTLIMFGGWNAGISYDSVFQSVDSGATWQFRSLLPYPVHTPAYIPNASDGFTYIIGGDYNNTTDDRAKVFRTKDFRTYELRTASSPFGTRVLHAATEKNGILYCGGGQFYTLNRYDGLFTDLYSSKDGGVTWVLVSNSLTFMGKNISGCFHVFNDKFMLVGGGIYDNLEGNKTYDNSVYSSGDGVIWNQEKDIPFAGLQYPNEFVWDGKLFISGGFTHTGLANSDSSAFIDKSGVWHNYIPPLKPTPNHAAAMLVNRDQVYMILGNTTNEVWRLKRSSNVYYETRLNLKSQTAIDTLRKSINGYHITEFTGSDTNEDQFVNSGATNYTKWISAQFEIWPNSVKRYEFAGNGTFKAYGLMASNNITDAFYGGAYFSTQIQTKQNFPGIAWLGLNHRYVMGLDDDLVGFRLEDDATTGIRFKHKLTDGRTVIAGNTTNGYDVAIDNSALLALKSTIYGFLPPVMSNAQMNAISSPTTGLMVFNSDSGLSVNHGGWKNVAYRTPTDQVLSSGTSVTIANGTTRLFVDPASAIASLAFTFPSAPYDGQIIKIYFGGQIQSGTVVTGGISSWGSTGAGFVPTTPTSATPISAGQTMIFEYRSANTYWYQVE